MTRSIERKSIWFLSLFLVLMAGLLYWMNREEGGSGEPVAEIFFTGPRSLPVTRDSTHQDPLKAPKPSFTRFTLSVRLEEALAPGGSIRIEQGYLFNGQALLGSDVRFAFPDPEIDDPTAANFLSMHTEGTPGRLSLEPCGLGRRVPVGLFPDGLPAGEPVEFRFGDPSGGSPGLAVPVVPLKIRLLTLVSPGQRLPYTLVSGEHPEIELYASGADQLVLLAPSLSTEAKVTLKIIPMRGKPGLRGAALPVNDFEGEIRLYANAQFKTPIGVVHFQPGDRLKELEVRLSVGLHRLAARSSKGVLQGVSNPFFVGGSLEENEALLPGLVAKTLRQGRIFWGSLQNHTAVGGHAASTPDEAFRCAREEGALDFCAITDHSSNASFKWEVLRKLPDRFDEPGRFSAFAGYEWTSPRYGHRHVLIKEGKNSFACSEQPTNDPHEKYAPDLNTLAQLAGSDPNLILIPHHSRRRVAPDHGSFHFGDPKSLPRQLLFEIYSWQGGSEGSEDDLPIQGRLDRTIRSGSGYRNALQAGYLMGITGDADGHLGLPGFSVGVERAQGLRYGMSGLTAVFSPELNREEVFGALENRRCYGTTGARIALFFFAEGETIMGQKRTARGSSVSLQAQVFGTAPITSLQLIAGGREIAYQIHPESLDAAVDTVLPVPVSSHPYPIYLRVKQADEQMAWSSPIWLERPAE